MKYSLYSDKPHSSIQLAAVNAASDKLSQFDRTRVTMACGTGKTFTQIKLAERLLEGQPGPKVILVQVPTLALVHQNLKEWNEQNDFGSRYSSICICSDPSLKSKGVLQDPGEDAFQMDEYDLAEMGIPKGSNAAKDIVRMNSWLDAREAVDPNAVSVIFTTYQSVKAVGMALGASERKVDFAVFDEAHKTAGALDKLDSFAYAMDDSRIQIKKRAFFTATERVRQPKKLKKNQSPEERERALTEDSDDESNFISMDNQEMYGPRAFNIPFREAAEKGIIVPYKIVISIINDENITAEDLRDKVLHDEHGQTVDARMIADIAALERAMKSHDLKKAITFHSTIAAAEDFANVTHSIEGATLSGFTRLHVSGEQGSTARKAAMDAYKDPSKSAIISNAKCLTEGVNVPATDLVAFIDPKTSKVDIVQAVGRALRMDKDKEAGYVFLPLHVNIHPGETPEKAFERSLDDFGQINDVLKALADSDEVLQEKLRSLGNRLGRGSKEDLWNGLPIEIQYENYPVEIDAAALVRAVETRIIRDCVTSWDVNFGLLQAYKAREGHCNMPDKHKEGDVRLGHWISTQRLAYKKGELSAERIQQLKELGLVWDAHGEQWNQSFKALQAYKARVGNCNVPQSHMEGDVTLGMWVNKQRAAYKKGELSAERIQQLEEIGFTWKAQNSEAQSAAPIKEVDKEAEPDPSISLPEFTKSRNRIL